jgi:hypothetical protein
MAETLYGKMKCYTHAVCGWFSGMVLDPMSETNYWKKVFVIAYCIRGLHPSWMTMTGSVLAMLVFSNTKDGSLVSTAAQLYVGKLFLGLSIDVLKAAGK